MRAVVKRALERILVRSGTAAALRHRRRGDTLVLCYHDIIEDDARASGDAGLHVPRAAFAGQLDALVRTHAVVPVADLDRCRRGAARPQAVITFDDAYVGALTLGIDELVRRGLPATVFVAPGILGTVPWWEWVVDEQCGRPTVDLRDDVIGRPEDGHDAMARWAAARGVRLRPDGTRIGTGEELATAATRPGITFGAHGWSHRNLAVLPHDELVRELETPLTWLRQRHASVTIPWMAYPFGLSSPSVARAAADAGYAGAFLVDGGWMGDHFDVRPHALPRCDIPAGLSLQGFELRLAGLSRATPT